MQPKQNKQLVPFARQLRKNMTKEERHLWYDYLRTHPARFTRQKILGKYIADFYSAAAKLVVELDGSQHYEDENQRKDAVRTSFLEEYGLMVLRIPNNAVNRNFRGVCEYIDYTIELWVFSLGGNTMQPKQNKQLVPFARQLRKNMTKEERHLWYDYLRTHPARFTRQKILGKYIADFYSAAAKLVVELDGSQHYEDENQRKDAVRTSFLEEYGLMVLRIPNNAVNRNFRGVCEYIDYTIEQRMTEE